MGLSGTVALLHLADFSQKIHIWAAIKLIGKGSVLWICAPAEEQADSHAEEVAKLEERTDFVAGDVDCNCSLRTRADC